MQKRLILLTLCFLLIIPLSAQEATPESDYIVTQNFFYTYHHGSGNRYVQGSGTFPDVEVRDYAFNARPIWLVAGNQTWSGNTPAQLITVQLENDTVASIDPLNGVVDVEFGAVSSLQSLALFVWRGQWTFDTPESNNLTNLTYLDFRLLADVSSDGGLSIIDVRPDGIFGDSLDLNIQPDAKVVVSDDNRQAVYANATNQRYVHGIMGDDIEGSSLVILRYEDDRLEIIEQIDLPGDAVFEGLSPMWADVNGDGIQDLITTVSDSQSGSRIRAYLFNENGNTIAVDGQAIGRPGRWQHQLAWGAFGANGEMQLVEVLTPHIGGVVRFYEFTGTELSIVSQIGGYTSHVIGSRNLDMAVAGDFDGDGQPEIVLPSQDRTRIAGIANTASGATVMWELPLDGTLVSNLAAVNTPDGLVLAAGREDGTVRVWSPQS